jgi:murein L,D-transpeptidase YafK
MTRALWLLLITLFDSVAPAYRIAVDRQSVDRVVVDKSERRLLLLHGAQVVATYQVSLGRHPQGRKQREGDERTPEGLYTLDWRNGKSSMFKSLHVSYPGSYDRQQAQLRGDDPGGMIMIHGQPNYFGWVAPVLQLFDWTDGCIAVSNAEMQEIWDMVPNNTPIEIKS